MESKKFNLKHSSHTITINKDDPFFKIIKIDLPIANPHFQNDSKILIQLKTIQDNFERKLELKNPDPLFKTFILNTVYFPKEDLKGEINEIIISVQDIENLNGEIELFYEIKNLDVSMENPWKDFGIHLNESDNSKILFSAPFGQGKTTFLNSTLRT